MVPSLDVIVEKFGASTLETSSQSPKPGTQAVPPSSSYLDQDNWIHVPPLWRTKPSRSLKDKIKSQGPSSPGMTQGLLVQLVDTIGSPSRTILHLPVHHDPCVTNDFQPLDSLPLDPLDKKAQPASTSFLSPQRSSPFGNSPKRSDLPFNIEDHGESSDNYLICGDNLDGFNDDIGDDILGSDLHLMSYSHESAKRRRVDDNADTASLGHQA